MCNWSPKKRNIVLSFVLVLFLLLVLFVFYWGDRVRRHIVGFIYCVKLGQDNIRGDRWETKYLVSHFIIFKSKVVVILYSCIVPVFVTVFVCSAYVHRVSARVRSVGRVSGGSGWVYTVHSSNYAMVRCRGSVWPSSRRPQTFEYTSEYTFWIYLHVHRAHTYVWSLTTLRSLPEPVTYAPTLL